MSDEKKPDLTPTELLSEVLHDQGQQIIALTEKLKATELDLREAHTKLETTRGLVVDRREHRSELLIFRSCLQDWIWRINRMAGVKDEQSR